MIKTNVKFIVGSSKEVHEFENETLKFSRSSELMITNASDSESELFESLKIWRSFEKNKGERNYYTIITSAQTPVESFRKYRIKKVKEDIRCRVLNNQSSNR
ncbi:hypothetical protein [Shouchella clausii]|uniref:hypothetical protein n=1 Tax=Shouchella clausii TaxID=79880 RepID=UPI000BA5F50F|nr:hypothetical protein [Shouchella clausii]PAD19117.1 hypothetical protein CHH73_03380 [Shouchella clausii]